jgi:hypothetical protein
MADETRGSALKANPYASNQGPATTTGIDLPIPEGSDESSPALQCWVRIYIPDRPDRDDR